LPTKRFDLSEPSHLNELRYPMAGTGRMALRRFPPPWSPGTAASIPGHVYSRPRRFPDEPRACVARPAKRGPSLGHRQTLVATDTRCHRTNAPLNKWAVKHLAVPDHQIQQEPRT